MSSNTPLSFTRIYFHKNYLIKKNTRNGEVTNEDAKEKTQLYFYLERKTINVHHFIIIYNECLAHIFIRDILPRGNKNNNYIIMVTFIKQANALAYAAAIIFDIIYWYNVIFIIQPHGKNGFIPSVLHAFNGFLSFN